MGVGVGVDPAWEAKKDADKCFGASLMRDSELVGECLRRMKEAAGVGRPLTTTFGPLVHSIRLFIGPSVHSLGPLTSTTVKAALTPSVSSLTSQ